MSVKLYGIYLAYAPTVDLRHEGLGRYLAAFMKGAAEREDVRFVVVCPSWSRVGLEELFSSEGVPKYRFEISAPNGKPLVLRGYEAYLTYKKRPKTLSVRQRFVGWVRGVKDAFMGRLERSLVHANSFFELLPLVLELGALTLVALLLSPLALIAVLILMLIRSLRRGVARLGRPILRRAARLQHAAGRPKEDGLVLRLYQQMEIAEVKRMLELTKNQPHVRAWYCPTAFWPAFNEIQGPKLMCVPDVVLADFPVGFSKVGGDRFLTNFESVESAIRSSQHFVTYSDAIKWETLVDRYAVRAANVAVIHHAPNDLSRWVTVRGFDNVEATSRHYCEGLLIESLRKSSNPNYAINFQNGSVKFLFYASQFRPNKNLISLLKAYEYLLRRRFVGHKLILTGNVKAYPAVQKFITKHSLQNDVLCLHGLTIQELAACYKLADLAVNPSLSEGGCPFTFTEALSVDTPVVMARIPVTEEVLADSALQEMTFFDPYDWKDMAHRIEWALNHRDHLLVVQRKTYLELAKRSWTDVVNEHIEVLDRIASADDSSEILKAA
jgi:glycosyltransferase involved in cell wall biosynthesis